MLPSTSVGRLNDSSRMVYGSFNGPATDTSPSLEDDIDDIDDEGVSFSWALFLRRRSLNLALLYASLNALPRRCFGRLYLSRRDDLELDELSHVSEEVLGLSS